YSILNSNLSNGTIFKITKAGALKTLVYFDGQQALNPFGEFILAKDGNLYAAVADVFLHKTLDGNGGAIFRLVETPNLTVTRSASGVKLTWNSFTNGIYRVEKIFSWNSTNWTPISSDITATANSTSFTNTSASAAQEFYRVVLL